MEQWSKIIVRWANGLKLAPICQELMDFTDGKFFAEFMKRYLPDAAWGPESQSVSQTFTILEKGLGHEFQFGPVVRIKDAAEGHEEELVKILTLLMYLGSVKYFQEDSELAVGLQDPSFSREVQFRAKCVLQALMDHHSVLTPALLTEALSSRVSETTGQLSAPVVKARMGSVARVARTSPGSPVIFSNGSPGGATISSPFRDYLDSPQTRQVAQLQRAVDDRNHETRRLRTDLETEKTEKQFLVEEAKSLRQEKRRLEEELVGVRQEVREQMAGMVPRDTGPSHQEAEEIFDKFQKNLTELRDQGKYLSSVEAQLSETQDERDWAKARLDSLVTKLAAATEDKHRVEISMENLLSSLTETKTENQGLSENVAELQSQLEDLGQQLQFSFLSGGRKSLAPSMTSFHYNPADMTNVSVDADDSMGAAGAMQMDDPGENMGDVVGQQREEIIDQLEVEKGQLEGDLDVEKEMRERTQGELVKEKELVKSVREELATATHLREATEIELREKEETVKMMDDELNERMERIKKLEVEMDEERASNVIELNKLGEHIEEVEERYAKTEKELESEKNLVAETRARLSEEISSRSRAEQDLGEERKLVSSLEDKLEQESSRKVMVEGELVNVKELLEQSESKEKVTQNLLESERNLGAEVKVMLEEETKRLRLAEEIIDQEQDKVKDFKVLLEEEKRVNEGISEELMSEKGAREKAVVELARERTLMGELRDTLDEQLTTAEVGWAKEKENLKQMKWELDEEQSKNEQLTIKFTEAEMSLKEFEERSKEAKVNFDNCSVKLNILEKENEEIQVELTARNSEVEELKNEQDNITKLLMEEQEKYENISTELKQAREVIVSKENQVKVEQNDCQGLKSELGHEKSKFTLLTVQLEEERSVVKSLKMENQEVIAKTTELALKLENIGEEIQTLQQDLTTSREQKADLEKRVRDHESKYSDTKARIEEISNELRSSNQKTKEVESQLVDEQTVVKALTEQKNLFEAEIVKLQHDLVLSSKEKSELCEKLSLEQKDKDAIGALHKSDVDSLNENVTAYATQLKEIRDEHSHLLSKITALESQLSEKDTDCVNHHLKLEEYKSLLILKDEDLSNKVMALELERKKVIELVESTDSLRLDKEKAVTNVEKERENIAMELVDVKMKQEDDTSRLQGQIDSLLNDNKEYDAILEGIEKKRQELEMNEVQLKETLAEVGANCDKRGVENLRLMAEKEALEEKIASLEREREEDSAESGHKTEFLQSQMDELNIEKDELILTKSEFETKTNALENEKVALQEELRKGEVNEDLSRKELVATRQENASLSQKLSKTEAEVLAVKECLSKHEEEVTTLNKSIVAKDSKLKEAEATSQKLKTQLVEEEARSKKEVDKRKEEVLSIQSRLAKHEEDSINHEKTIETLKKENESLQSFLQKLEEENETSRTHSKKLEVEHLDVSEKINVIVKEKELCDEKIKQMQEENLSNLDKLKEEKIPLETKIMDFEREKKITESRIKKLEEDLVLEKSSKSGLAGHLSQFITDTNALKDQLERTSSEHAQLVKDKDELQNLLEEKEKTLAELRENGKTLSEKEAEVKSLRESLATAEIKYTDLEQQASSSEDVQDKLKEVKERYEARHKEVVKTVQESNHKKMKEFCTLASDKVKEAEEKQKLAEDKCEQYKNKISGMVEENDKLNGEALELLNKKYTKNKEDYIIVHDKYNKCKEKVTKLQAENEKLVRLLETKEDTMEMETNRRELVKVKNENRTLITQLSYADTKLREWNNSDQGSGTSRRSTRSRDNSLNSLPGRPRRQSSAQEELEDDNVFKLPGVANTPGRAKTGRTVSDSRMSSAVSNRSFRPPTGSGSLFNCDEEAGEVFSSSYLTDLKEGHCEVDDSKCDSRMSELARRNTLAPAHLKSAYPIESQFCIDASITEESIRHSRLKGRLTEGNVRSMADVNSPHPSPVTRLSQAASSLSLDSSPARSTRSSSRDTKSSRLRPSDSSPARSTSSSSRASISSRLPPPTSFTIDPPKPGTAVRKVGSRLPAPTTRLAKQACKQEHGTKKQSCEGGHEEVEQLSPEPSKAKKRKTAAQTKKPTTEPELDSSQDSNLSFSRDSLRGSKRSKMGGNISYNRPGPPTPGRNKSTGNLSLTGSVDTALANLTSNRNSLLISNTPEMSRISTRSSTTLKTPLLDTTNIPTKQGNKSKTSAKISQDDTAGSQEDDELSLQGEDLQVDEKAGSNNRQGPE